MEGRSGQLSSDAFQIPIISLTPISFFSGFIATFTRKKEILATVSLNFIKNIYLCYIIYIMAHKKLYIIFLLGSLWSFLPPFCFSAEGKDFTVVIDPGHGGKDPGAIGKRGKEKNINLSVALKLGALIRENCNDVNIVYTRQKDTFVALDKRAKIANDAKADLFISIHTNSVAKGRTIRGTETYTLGLHRTDDNLEVAKKENSVILIENDYEQRYAGFNPNSSESYIIFEFLQDKNMEKSVELATSIQKQFKTTAKRIDKGVHQAGFLVLRETTMPGVLVELGYISTPSEEQYLLTEAGTSALAKSIYLAFLSYKRKYDINGSSGQPRKETVVEPAKTEKQESVKTQTTPRKTPVTKTTDKSEKPIFKIQILTASKKLPANSKQFKGLAPVNYYQEKGIYKYTYGESHDYNKVLRTKKQITSKFKDAFIVAFKNGEKINVNEAIKEFKNNR